MPECADTTMMSAPAAFIRGTYFFAISTMPGKIIWPATFALSQIAMPGLVRPRMPTRTGRPWPRCSSLITYGWKAGFSSFACSALAPSSGKFSCSSKARTVGMP